MAKTRIVVTGASGQLGTYVLRHLLESDDVHVIAWTGSRSGSQFGLPLLPVDLTDSAAVSRAFDQAQPDIVIHLAALCRVDACYQNPELAVMINVHGTRSLADLVRDKNCRLVQVSTDMVFDGTKGNYSELDHPNPINVYGRTKLAGEMVAAEIPGAAILRVSLLYGPTLNGRPSFFDEQVRAITAQKSVNVFYDEWRTPLSYLTASSAIVEIARSSVSGCIHLAGPERMSRSEMADRLAVVLGGSTSAIVKRSRLENPSPEPRPPDLSLDCTRWRTLFPSHPWPRWDDGIRQFGQLVPLQS